ncbi:putative beta-lysine N-acetyltransferase, partial [bacterium]|nr:putative beta-lysine N-acetyltransferase [bacterium]
AMRRLEDSDAEGTAKVFSQVFESYPFPIHDPVYIRQTMTEHVSYYGILQKDKLIAVSSAEMDEKALNAEMTDFATLPEFRGAGLATALLQEMEKAMAEKGFPTLYTIARSISFGMNITFAKLGYTYSGTLHHNTHIIGSMENMNVWFKRIG